MVNEKELVSGVMEWRVTVPNGRSVKLVEETWLIRKAWLGVLGLILGVKLKMWGVGEMVWNMGANEPRKVIHCLKVGLALTLVSLFYYVRPLYDGVGASAVGAVVTVISIFEFTVGGTLYKGFNRAAATLIAASLAISIHPLVEKSGEEAEPVIRGSMVFLLASAATFTRFIPTVKTQFDYGVTSFIMTFILVSVSGYRKDKVIELAKQRVSTIALGTAICTMVCLFVLPVWAGSDLHLLISRNIEKLANSLDGCVVEYFKASVNAAGEETCRKSQGYTCVLNSKASEERLANLARWEPVHGGFGFRHPWQKYLTVGTAIRHCAYCIEALSGCINSETQAPELMKKQLKKACMGLSSKSAIVLKELANSTKSMRKSSRIDILVQEMNSAVEELQNALRSLPNQPIPPSAKEVQEKKQLPMPECASLQLMDVLPLVTVASMLIETSVRIQGILEAVDDLGRLANFKVVKNCKPKQIKPACKPPPLVSQGQEAMKAFQ